MCRCCPGVAKTDDGESNWELVHFDMMQKVMIVREKPLEQTITKLYPLCIQNKNQEQNFPRFISIVLADVNAI